MCAVLAEMDSSAAMGDCIRAPCDTSTQYCRPGVRALRRAQGASRPRYTFLTKISQWKGRLSSRTSHYLASR